MRGGMITGWKNKMDGKGILEKGNKGKQEL
jgi:hypothetical protein